MSPFGHAGAEKKIITPTFEPAASWILRLESSYVGESDFSDRNASGDAFELNVEASHRWFLGHGWPEAERGGWYLRLGVEYGRFDFSHDGGIPLPDKFQTAAGIISLEYLVGDDSAVILETRPGFHFEDDPDSSAFDAPTKLAIAIPLDDERRVVAVAGVVYSALRSYQVIPVIGLRWIISDRWTLFAIPPEPRLIYHASDTLSFWAGGELTGGSFKTDDRRLKTDRELSGGVVTYSDWRVGAGGTWFPSPDLAVDFGAGYSIRREFDYHRAGKEFRTDDGAPFVKISVTASF